MTTPAVSASGNSRNPFTQFLGNIRTGITRRVQNALNRNPTPATTAFSGTRADTLACRQEIPFERWFADYNYYRPIEGTTNLIKARLWAVLAAGEGTFKTTLKTGSYALCKIFRPADSDLHLQILKAQWQGLTLSLVAIASPNLAKEKARNAPGQPLIGARLSNWTWGTPYSNRTPPAARV